MFHAVRHSTPRAGSRTTLPPLGFLVITLLFSLLLNFEAQATVRKLDGADEPKRFTESVEIIKASSALDLPQHPSPADPVLPNDEFPDENKVETEPGQGDDVHDDPAVLTNYCSRRYATENNSIQQSTSLQDCSTVSLFILYHSWKIFLN